MFSAIAIKLWNERNQNIKVHFIENHIYKFSIVNGKNLEHLVKNW